VAKKAKEAPPEEKQRVTIVDIRDVPSTRPGRLGRLDTMVTYQVDAMRIYMVTIPKEEFNEETLRAAIARDLAERKKWIGRTLEV